MYSFSFFLDNFKSKIGYHGEEFRQYCHQGGKSHKILW